uniref:Uncharacterized protein n=1 Tax=Tanacetum cinerariifolium TaxID=118510 RepID=A0A699KY54_TANCI|nr:hypothetical protein [Tanacetum cinerariifolium]
MLITKPRIFRPIGFKGIAKVDMGRVLGCDFILDFREGGEEVSDVASVSAASTKVPVSALPTVDTLSDAFHCVMVLEAITGAFRHRKNQPTMPLWHSPPQVLLVLIMRQLPVPKHVLKLMLL